MDPVLLAVAVHDDAGRLEDAGIDAIRVAAGQRCSFRVSYRLADSPTARDEAHVSVEFRLDSGDWVREEARLVDRPGLPDDVHGFLEFTTPELEEGIHSLEYRVRFEDAQHRIGGSEERQKAVDGRVAITVS